MKKFYLLISGALFAWQAVAAQEIATPVFGPDDPHQIFFQGFEPEEKGVDAAQAWEEWQKIKVDSITEITYYKRQGTGTLNSTNIYDGKEDWEIFDVRTDSIQYLTNGVWGNVNDDKYAIQTDGASTDRAQAFAKYGEDGGDYFFRYTAANGSGASNYSNGLVARYTRNMFIRGIDIQDETSYRLTVFVKARSYATTNVTTPTFYADVMRGFFNSEKPFSMDLGINAGKFEYTKNDFVDNQWEKITFMTYYLNDSIADCFMYGEGYWWDSGWTWKHANGNTYNYIKQPDKFFARLSFASDSTIFEMDNLSLTKSWIGGVEHTDNMIRVDFGYQTNLKDLAKAAYAETGIAAVELPGEYFSVFGKIDDGNGNKLWFPIEIASAEYHDDGYMYMWSKDLEYGGEPIANPFDRYDSVIVSFTNPIENEKIRLNYNGSTYPCALDKEWVDAGKAVKNFKNERSTLNPYIATDKNGKPVYSMKQLPPVLQAGPFEDGSFGLDSFDEIKVELSKKIVYDNIGENSDYAFLRVTKSGFKEIWTVKETTDTYTIFQRSAADKANHGDLKGAYQFEFVALKGENTDYRTPNPVLTYEFGKLDTNPDPNPVPILASTFAQDNDEQCVPKGLAIWDGNNKTFTQGKVTGTKSRFYPTWPTEESGFAEGGIYLSSRSSALGGHLYYGYDAEYKLTLAPGTYSLNFRASQWDGYPIPITVYVFSRDLTDNPQANPVSDDKKITLGTFTPTVTASSGNIQNSNPESRTWENEPFSFQFNITTAGDYVIEWYSEMGESGNAKSYGGMMMTDFTITPSQGISYAYVIKLNQAVQKAEAKLAVAGDAENNNKYLGKDYEAFQAVINTYKTWQHTAPSEYNKATATVNKAIADMQLRMDTVDLFYTTENKAIEKIAEFDANTNGEQGLETYKSLEAMITANSTYDCSTKTSSELTADIKAYNDAVKALDDRIAAIKKYNDKLDEIEVLVNAENARTYYAEYDDMVEGLADGKVYDKIGTADDEFAVAYTELCEIKNAYVFRGDAYDANTKQIKALFALADTLEYNFNGKKDSIKAVIDELEVNDEKLSEVLREASIMQLYKKLAGMAATDTIDYDITALVPNFFIATTATSEEFTNSGGTWYIASGSNNTAIPNWKVTYAGANWQRGGWYPGKQAMDWANEAHTFIAGVHFVANTTGTAAVTVPGLPAATYTASVELGQNNLSNSRLYGKADTVNIEVVGTKSTSRQVFKIENIYVKGGSDLEISYAITGASGSGHVDVTSVGLSLVTPDPKADYTALITEQEAKVADLITFVDAPQQASKVQFFNLGGVQIDAVKSGDILIKRTTLSNGQVVTEKVLVK